jgi:hypothetical protein
MSKRALLVVGVILGWLVLAVAGYQLSRLGQALIGSEATLIAASIVATIAVVMLLGQYFAGTSDYFLSVDNPRPLDDHEAEIISTAWGFADENGRTATAEQAGEGFADVRLFASRVQMAKSLFSFGFRRPVSIVWRGNAGQHPLGDA